MIRDAEEKDIGAVAELFYELHEHHVQLFGEFCRSADMSFFQNAVRKMFADSKKNIAVSEHNGIVDGYAVFELSENEDELHFYRKVCCVEQIAVKKEVRRNGFGRELMNFIREYAAENQCDAAELGVWYENYDAVDFFVKCGFMPRTIKLENKLNQRSM